MEQIRENTTAEEEGEQWTLGRGRNYGEEDANGNDEEMAAAAAALTNSDNIPFPPPIRMHCLESFRANSSSAIPSSPMVSLKMGEVSPSAAQHCNTTILIDEDDGEEGEGEAQKGKVAENGHKIAAKMKSRQNAKMATLLLAKRQWLEALKCQAEVETMTVLFAKTVLNNENGQTQQQQQPTGSKKITTTRVPIGNYCPVEHRPIPMPRRLELKVNNPPPKEKESSSPKESPNFLPSNPPQFSPPPSMGPARLCVTRIDTLANQPIQPIHPKQQQFSTSLTAREDGGPFCSTVCLLAPSQMGQSLVMSRSSRVEIDSKRHRGNAAKMEWTKAINAEQQNGTLVKFAQSLPNWGRIGQRLARVEGSSSSGTNANDDEEEEEEEGEELTRQKSPIYRPAIRYRRRCAAGTTTGGRERRKAVGCFGLSLCHSSPHLATNHPFKFRHSIRVNQEGQEEEMDDEDEEEKHEDYNKNNEKARRRAASRHSPLPQAGCSSTDSGQCSAGGSPPYGFCLVNEEEANANERRRTNMLMDDGISLDVADSSIEHPAYAEIKESAAPLPGYARIASTIDQALRLSSSIFAQFTSASSAVMMQGHQQQMATTQTQSSTADSNNSKRLLDACRTFIQMIRQSPCGQHMPKTNIELVRRAIRDMEKATLEEGEEKKKMNRKQEEMPTSGECQQQRTVPNDYLAVCARQMVESCMLIFVRILSKYLGHCSAQDRLLLIALEQFVHLLLFGDELCVEAVRMKAVDNLLAIGMTPLISAETLKLLLRALAVLCGTAKGCLQLISMGGLDFVLRCVCLAEDCAFEAAGCIAQLCSPGHNFVRPLGHPLVPRLLQLADLSQSPESLLLCLAALANLSAQCPEAVCDLLYVNNAVLRLIRAANKPPNASNLFVQEQLVTILTRMANRGHERALLAQGAVPALCKMLEIKPGKSFGHKQNELERRIAYKAAICLGCLASTGSGLRELHEQKVHQVLMDIGSPGNRQRTMTPVQLICASIRQKLENTYQLQLQQQTQLETAV